MNNIRGRTGPDALSYSYGTATNRLTQVTGAVTRNYSYNAAGEIIGDGVRGFALNARGQLQSVSGVATYQFDGNGKRIKSVRESASEYTLYDKTGTLVYSESGAVRTTFLLLKDRILVELSASNGVTTPKYLHGDWLGSPRKATNASGLVLWNETFTAFGEKMNGVDEALGFTGHVQDADIGLTYMQARFYDAATGRFLSPDPVRLTDDFNLYAYVSNNPVNTADPSGKCGVCLYARPTWTSLNRFPVMKEAFEQAQRNAPSEAQAPNGMRVPIRRPFESSEAFARRVENSKGGPYKNELRQPDVLDRGSLPSLPELIADWVDALFNGWKSSAPPVTDTTPADAGQDVDPAIRIDALKMEALTEDIMNAGEQTPPDPCQAAPKLCTT